MSFVGVQFEEEEGVAIVHKSWLTPRKKEVFWPPYKTQDHYYRALKNKDSPCESNWSLYKLSRIFFEENDYDKALKKIKLVEDTSDVQTDNENKRRKTKTPRRLLLSSDSESGDDVTPRKVPRPPPIKLQSSIDTPTPASSHQNIIHTIESQIEEQRDFSGHTTSRSTTPTSTSRSEFEEKILKLVLHVKQQNQQILSWIQNQSISAPSTSQALPSNIPIKFPIATTQDFDSFEIYLKEDANLLAICDYLSTLGGKDATTTTNRVMKRCLTNELATNFSFFGKRLNKRAINDTLFKDLIIRAVKKSQTAATEQEVENIIKTWLKHAPQRAKLDSK